MSPQARVRFPVQGYDLIMLIVLGMATIFGAIKGFAWQVASLASIIVSYVVAYRFRFDLAEMIQAKPPWNQFLAMLILYVGTSFVIWVGFRLLSTSIDRVRLKEFDRHLGAAFGLAKGLVYCLLITMFATSLLGPKQQAAICHSRSGYYISKALDNSMGILPQEIHDVVGPYLASLDDKLKNGGAFGDKVDSNAVGNGEASDSIWPSGGIPGLEGFPTGMQNEIQNGIQNSIQNGIRNALPQLLPGMGAANSNSASSENWDSTGGLPSFDTGSIFPPVERQNANAAPQIFPPLGTSNSNTPLPSSSVAPAGYGNGLRPSSPTTPQQAQQPSYVLPR
ncbi:MAG: CvpA family protein [Planctomycetales bacterium]|nr:CvpA family protein [Planctomycetales bacterium]